MRRRLPPRGGVRLMLWLRGRFAKAAWQSIVHAPLKLLITTTAWTVLLVGLYLLVYRGLAFVSEAVGIGPFFLDRLWYLFLFVISVMLLVSQIATAYSTLVRSEEAGYWMSLPLSARWIVRAKWLESSLYSAWAVFLLVIPLALAYLVVLHKPLWLVGWVLVILVPLVELLTALSTAALLVWLRWVRLRLVIRRELLPVGFFILSLAIFWLLGARSHTQQQDAWFVALQELLPRMRLAMSIWVPSCWMARALNAGLNAQWVEAGLFAGLLWSTALVCLRLLDHTAARVLFPVLQRQAVRGERSLTTAQAPKPYDLRRWLKGPWLAYVRKDLLLLRRDAVQWSQALVFFGLLGAYFANIHRLATMSVEPSWRVGVTSLNLACTMLVFGALAVRFLFPQMSLEGKRLWLIHVVPGGLRQLLLSKVACYSVLAIFIIDGLLALSATRLQVPQRLGWWLGVVGVIAGMSLVGLSLGLGARLIDLHGSDPGKIVSSSNGALTLVLMLTYVGLVTAGIVLAWKAWASNQPSGLLVASLAILILSWLFGYLPLRAGLHRLAHLEF